MKHLLHSFIFTLCLPLLVSCSSSDEQEVIAAEESTDSVAVLVSKIAECSKLYTAEMQMHKVIVAEDPLELGGIVFGTEFKIDLPVGERKIAIPINAQIEACIDLSEFSKNNVKMDGDEIIIELPKPQITLISTEIDHEEVKTDIAFFRSKFSDDEITEFSKKGRDEIIKAVPKTDIIEKAQSGAAAVIVPMLVQLGYKDKNIRVVFDEDVTSNPADFIKRNLMLK